MPSIGVPRMLADVGNIWFTDMQMAGWENIG